jgi:hypothetical protein
MQMIGFPHKLRRTKMPEIRAVPTVLPDARLPGADWADCFEIRLPGKSLTAIDAARLALGRLPFWVRTLMRLRNVLATVVGLKKGADGTVAMEDRIGIFPLISSDERTVVLGLDDWHLDFRIVIDVESDGAGGTLLRAATLVRRKNLFGWLYIGVVAPFHKLIVPTMLRSASRRYLTAVTV